MIDMHHDLATPATPPAERDAALEPGLAPGDWSAEITGALRAEADAVRRLRELAERQGRFIVEGRLDTARALVAHRATLIDAIRGHEARVRTLAAAGTGSGELAASVAEEIERLQRAIRTDLRAVAERDAEDRAVIIERRDAAAGELGRVSGGRRARRAYAGPAPAAPRFGDERG